MAIYGTTISKSQAKKLAKAQKKSAWKVKKVAKKKKGKKKGGKKKGGKKKAPKKAKKKAPKKTKKKRGKKKKKRSTKKSRAAARKRNAAKVAVGMRVGYKRAGKGHRVTAVSPMAVKRCPTGKMAVGVVTAKVKTTKSGRKRVHYSAFGRCVTM
jgi:hypothetical protein